MSGCGRGTGSVKGKVFYKDKPLKGGNVTFVGTDTVSSSISEDGSYTIEKIAAGPVKICVDTESLNPKKFKGVKYSPPGGQKSPYANSSVSAEDMARRYTAIPPDYADPAQTSEKYEIKPGPQEYDIKLK
jgi:hypothetical protein